MADLFRLDGKVALITGASGGLGAAMARALAEAGADVVLHALGQPASATEAALRDTGRRVALVTADLAQPDAAARLAADATTAFGRIDILVNNAGTIRRRQAAEHSDEDWDDVIAVNLSSVFRLSRAIGAQMLARRQGGKIINIASLLAFQGGITVPGYAASKGGVMQLTKALSNEWAAHRINVNAIAPGYMETDNTAALRQDATRLRQITERIPAGRWGKPEDLAGTVVFLASGASDYVHGHVLVVDGGVDGPMTAITRTFSKFVGPAALTAAGMIGAGAVATRLLAGAWFGFDLLWVALYVIPMVIFTLDSASRVAAVSGGRGMLEMVRADIGPWLAWTVFLAAFGVNIVVNMSQMAAMAEGAYGAFGALPPSQATAGLVSLVFALTAGTVTLAVLGGYKRVEKVMTFLLVAKLACFIIVAAKGLLDWYTWPALAHGLVPSIPENVPVVGTTRVREGFTQILAIAGQALPPTVFLTYGYLATNAGYTVADVKRAFWKTVQNLGIIWGLFSVVVIVAGTTALHNVYTGNGPVFLGVSHFSQIESIPVAGQVLGPAFPGVLSFIAPRFFSLGLVGAGFTTLIAVSLTMTYLCLDIARRDWHFTKQNKPFQVVFAAWIAVPALLTPFWALPALLKAIIAMVGNLLLAPVAVAIIFYFINQRRMGEFKAGAGRNLVLLTTLVFALTLAITGIVRFLR